MAARTEEIRIDEQQNGEPMPIQEAVAQLPACVSRWKMANLVEIGQVETEAESAENWGNRPNR